MAFVLSNTFYRLAKKKAEGVYDVYDFHTTANRARNMWISWTQFKNYTDPDNVFDDEGKCAETASAVTIEYMRKVFDKKRGNEEYLKLKAKGFVLIGKFEESIFGEIRRLK